MKRLVTISLILFWTVYVAIVAGGLAQHFFSTNNSNSVVPAPVDTKSLGQMTLDAATVGTHNTKSSCWMIIDSKVYDISGYFGSHPAGDAIIVNFCGKEASTAFHLSPHRHSSYAQSLLNSFFIGDFGATINQATSNNQSATTGQQTTTNNQQSTPVTTTGGSTYTAATVASHNTSGNCWIIVSNKVYNVTSYISSGTHLAGSSAIIPYCGRDATSAFGVHNSTGYSVISGYYIGTIGSATTGTGAAATAPATTVTPSVPNTSRDDD